MIRTRLLALLTLGLFVAPASAAVFSQYQLVETFNLPVIDNVSNQGAAVFDNLSDGRLIVVSTLVTDPSFLNFLGEPHVYVETAPGSRAFTNLGALPLPGGAKWDAGGGAFLRVSTGGPGNARIAIGNNRSDTPLVGVFDEADFVANGTAATVNWYSLPHSSAAWQDDQQLAINDGTFTSSRVRILDTNSSTASPAIETVVDGVDGASGSVGFDSQGNLVTGNGFASGSGSATGHIRSFLASDLVTALATDTPIDFETGGTPVGTHLSAGSLEFDAEDNLLVGGSNFFGGGEADFFKLLPGPSAGAVPIRIFDPDTAATSFYVLTYNESRQEFYAYEPFSLDFPSNTDNTRVWVFRAAEASAAFVPEPRGAALIVLAGVASILLGRGRSKV